MKYVLSIFIILSLSCSGQDCNTLPLHYSSYDNAVEIIKETHFKIEESVNTSKSSWIRSASYYSCDGETGYFIFSTDEKTYIHAGVPVELWNEFKEAESFGSFYDHYIRGRYRFNL
jgi:hypothetical protein